MSRAKVVHKTLASREVLDLFQSTLGGGNAEFNPEIVWPKFKRLRHHVLRFARLVEWLAQRSYLQDAFPHECAAIAAWAARLLKEARGVFDEVPDLDRYGSAEEVEVFLAASDEPKDLAMLKFVPRFERVPAAVMQAFRERYSAACNHDTINTPILTCKQLLPHRGALDDRGKLQGRFLKQAGLTFAPLPGLEAANFKAFYQSDLLTEGQHEVMLVFLHNLFTVSYAVYETASEPDVDVNDFVEVVMASLGDIKKQIPRCDLAFKKIADSVGLLKKNFGTYFREFKASGDSTIMLQNFVADVAQESGGSSARLTMQFQRIISHYRKVSAGQAKDPRIQALFTHVDANLKELERINKDGEGDDTEDNAQPEVDEPVPEEEKPAPLTEEERQVAQARRKRLQRTRRNASRQIAEHLDDPAAATNEPAATTSREPALTTTSEPTPATTSEPAGAN